MTPLTKLSADELLFRDTVRDFARTEITPLVRSMDEAQKFDPKLLRKLFDLGLMGIQVPEQHLYPLLDREVRPHHILQEGDRGLAASRRPCAIKHRSRLFSLC